MNLSNSPRRAVLLLAYGTPDGLDDVPAYLLDVRRGRPPTSELVKEMTDRYAAIGGKSPLTQLTHDQAEALRLVFKQREIDLPVYVGMRHWRPWIKDTLSQMHEDGIQEAVVLILAPHHCELTLKTYSEAVDRALDKLGLGEKIRLHYVDYWSDQPNFLQAQIDALREALTRVPKGKHAKVIFSAHSLPKLYLGDDDPYEDDLRANANRIAMNMRRLDWTFAFQSAGASGGEWLGPDINEVLPSLREDGVEWIVSMPIGFVCDHLEILYDIDIETKALAKEIGMGLTRVEAMNTHPRFISGIADAVIELLNGLTVHHP